MASSLKTDLLLTFAVSPSLHEDLFGAHNLQSAPNQYKSLPKFITPNLNFSFLYHNKHEPSTKFSTKILPPIPLVVALFRWFIII